MLNNYSISSTVVDTFTTISLFNADYSLVHRFFLLFDFVWGGVKCTLKHRTKKQQRQIPNPGLPAWDI